MPYPQAVQLWGVSREPLFKSSIPKRPEKSLNTLQPYSSSITCIFSFKYNLAVKLKEKNTLPPKKQAFVELPICGSWVASSPWAVQGKLLRYDVALHQGCLITGAAMSDVVEEASLVRLLRVLRRFCPGKKLNWSNGLFPENLSHVSPQCILDTLSHKKPLLESSWGLISWPGLWSHQYIQNHLLP